MSDILKKMKEIDENEIEKTDPFLDKSIEDYKKFYDIFKPFSSNAEEQPFSSDFDKFNNDCLEFISFIRQCISNGNVHVLYLLRKGNTIHYGRYDQGI